MSEPKPESLVGYHDLSEEEVERHLGHSTNPEIIGLLADHKKAKEAGLDVRVTYTNDDNA